MASAPIGERPHGERPQGEGPGGHGRHADRGRHDRLQGTGMNIAARDAASRRTRESGEG